MAKYIIKAKDGSGGVQKLVPNRNNKNKVIIIMATDKSKAITLPTRRGAKDMLRKKGFASSNFEIELFESGRNLEFIGCKEYGEE